MFKMFSEIDDCIEGTHNCDKNAKCTNLKGSFKCECNDGYNDTGRARKGECQG